MQPTNLNECFFELRRLLAGSAKKEIEESTSEDIMIDFHHGLGRHIRNEWGLWTGSLLKDYFNEMGLEHADDMSGVILTSYWRHVHNKPLNVEEQVKSYQDYWRKNS